MSSPCYLQFCRLMICLLLGAADDSPHDSEQSFLSLVFLALECISKQLSKTGANSQSNHAKTR